MTDATMLERAARALKDEIGKALDAKPLPFAGDTGNWSAKGDMQTLDLEACVRAVLMAVRDLGEAECERVRGYFPGQDIMADTLFSLSIDDILADGEGR